MRTGTIVRDKETELRYQVGAYLGEGATAVVYEAETTEPSASPRGLGPKVAVKVPKNETWRDYLREELKTLQDIQKGWGSGQLPPCPRVREGTIDESEPDSFALLLEYIPREWQVFRQKLGEKDLLLLARQYARLLQIVHEDMNRICGDRKSDDLYWDANQKRLIVLDWNVTNKRQLETAEDERLVRANISTFAKFWYQLAVGEPVAGVPTIDAKAPEGWAKLPRGLRRLLIRALDDTPRGYKAAREWLEDIRWFSDWFDKDPEALITEAERQQKDLPGGALAASERILDLLALAEGKGLSEELAPRAHSLKQWAGATEKRRADVVKNTIAQAQGEIKAGRSKGAREELNGVLSSMELLPEEELTVRRWFAVVQALRNVEEKGRKTEEIRPGLIAAVEAMGSQTWGSASGKLNDALKGEEFGGASEPILTARNALNLLLCDVAVHQLAQAKNYAEVELKLKELRGLSREHHDAVLATHPGLLEQIETAKREQEKKEKQARLQEAKQKITSVLQSAAVAQPPSWPTGDLQELLAGLDSEQDPQLADLKRVHEKMARRAYTSALQEAAALSSYYKGANVVLDLCTKVAEQRVKELAQTARWPDEVDEGLELVAALYRYDPPRTGVTVQQQLQRDKASLESKKKLQGDLGKRVGDPSQLIEKLEDQGIDEALKEAKEKKIELFERLDGKEEQWEVSYFLTVRERARMQKILENLNIRLAELIASFSEQKEKVSDIAGHVNTIDDEISSLEKQLNEKGYTEDRLNSLNMRVGLIQQLRAAIQELPPSFGVLEGPVIKLEARLVVAPPSAFEADRQEGEREKSTQSPNTAISGSESEKVLQFWKELSTQTDVAQIPFDKLDEKIRQTYSLSKNQSSSLPSHWHDAVVECLIQVTMNLARLNSRLGISYGSRVEAIKVKIGRLLRDLQNVKADSGRKSA